MLEAVEVLDRVREGRVELDATLDALGGSRLPRRVDLARERAPDDADRVDGEGARTRPPSLATPSPSGQRTWSTQSDALGAVKVGPSPASLRAPVRGSSQTASAGAGASLTVVSPPPST